MSKQFVEALEEMNRKLKASVAGYTRADGIQVGGYERGGDGGGRGFDDEALTDKLTTDQIENIHNQLREDLDVGEPGARTEGQDARFFELREALDTIDPKDFTTVGDYREAVEKQVLANAGTGKSRSTGGCPMSNASRLYR
jgi:hypothetical protein